MKIAFHKHFEKQLLKLPKRVRASFSERLVLYLEDPKHPLLNVHTLKGELYPYESMNVDADHRAIFISTKSGVTFLEIGSHSKLYGK